jgi:hypothetical protein
MGIREITQGMVVPPQKPLVRGRRTEMAKCDICHREGCSSSFHSDQEQDLYRIGVLEEQVKKCREREQKLEDKLREVAKGEWRSWERVAKEINELLEATS